jgi:hypothetical protein
MQFPYPLASIKDAKATGEALSPEKKTSSTSKHGIFNGTFFFFCGSLLPSCNADLDSDPELFLAVSFKE